jgi:hypothetical protein
MRGKHVKIELRETERRELDGFTKSGIRSTAVNLSAEGRKGTKEKSERL